MRSYDSWRDLAPVLKSSGRIWLYMAEFGVLAAVSLSDLPLVLKIVCWAIGALVLGVFGKVTYSLGRRLETEEALPILERDRRAPVIYLRSFTADRSSIQGDLPAQGADTDEDLYASLLGDLGPMITVGRPGEPVPPIGVPRLYVQDEHWVKCVTEFMQKSRLIILQYGMSAGLRTELDIAFTLDPRRVLLSFPGEAQWEHFRAARSLPATDKPVALLGFRDGWTPRVVAVHEQMDFGNPYHGVGKFAADVPPADSPQWSWSRAGYWPFAEPRPAPAPGAFPWSAGTPGSGRGRSLL